MSLSVQGIIPYSNVFVKELERAFLLLTQEPQHRFLLISTVSAGVNADSGELSSLTPAFDGKGRNPQYLCDFPNG
jgi:hypothetical protein